MSNFIQRLLSGLVYVALIFTCFAFSPFASQILMLVFFGFCLYEMFDILETKKLLLPGLITGLSLFAFHFYDVSVLRIEELWITGITLLLFMYALISGASLKELAKSIFGLLYLLLPFGLTAYMLSSDEGGKLAHMILALFITLWANDTFAYLTGRKFGKNKLAPKLSPGKTWEGLIGGLFASLAVGYFLDQHFISNFWIILSPILGLAGTFGDLFESKLKRETGIKDSSNFIPGHGGFLDRLDSFLFALPVFYICYNCFPS